MKDIFISALIAAGVWLSPASAATPEQRAAAVLRSTPLVDGHNDWAMALREAYGPEGALKADLNADATLRKPPGHTDIGRLRQGMLGAQIWSVYVSADLPPAQAVQQTSEQIRIVKSFAERYPDTFTLVTTADGLEKAFRAGRIASLIGIEGAHQIDDDIGLLRKAYADGVRSMTLAHSRNSRLFDSATDTPAHHGITEGGKAMIAEMNRLGMLVDLSHVSPETMHMALDATRSPVIFSHSGARAVTDHPRDVPDDVLKRLPKNGGLVMATFVPGFVSQARVDWEKARKDAEARGEAALKAFTDANPRPSATLAQVADHIDHIAKVAGHDHVGIGGDFDGVPELPVGLESVAAYPALFAELARRGWSDADLAKLAGGNFLRVLRANEAVARQLAK